MLDGENANGKLELGIIQTCDMYVGDLERIGNKNVLKHGNREARHVRHHQCERLTHGYIGRVLQKILK